MNFIQKAKGILDGEREELVRLANEYAQVSLQEKELKKKKESLKRKMVALNMIGETVDTKNGKVSIYVSERLKADFQLILKLQKEGYDTAELYTKKIDSEKIKKLGEDHPEVKQYFEYTKSVGIRVSK